MPKNRDTMIGFDPLAWLDEERESSDKSRESKKPVKKQKTGKIDVLGHEVDEISLVKGYEILSKNINKIVSSFYDSLFEKHPEVEKLFNKADRKSQENKLVQAIVLVHDNLDDVKALKSLLEDLGQRHIKYGAVAEHYPAVVELLLDEVKKEVGRPWTKAINKSWFDLLNAVTETMLSAYDNKIAKETKEIPDSNNPVLVLDSVQDISKVRMLKNDIMALINDSDAIDIDASEVEKIDGSTMQLLTALFIYAQKNNMVINWIKPTRKIIEGAEVLGIKQLLELA